MKKITLSGKPKIYLKTLGLLGLFILLSAVIYKLAVSQIPLQRGKFSAQMRKEQTLKQKSELLRTLEKSILEQADLTSFALPNKNASFAVVSQLNKLAGENLVFITNLRIGGETKDGNLSSSDLGFDVEGTVSSVLSFLKGVGNIAPITLIDKIQLNQTQDVARATVRVKTFWADFPSTLPAVSEPIEDLTKEEEEILVKVVNLTPPDFVNLEPQAPTEKTNPF